MVLEVSDSLDAAFSVAEQGLHSDEMTMIPKGEWNESQGEKKVQVRQDNRNPETQGIVASQSLSFFQIT